MARLAVSQNVFRRSICCLTNASNVRLMSKFSDDFPEPDPELRPNYPKKTRPPEREMFPGEYALEPTKGRAYDKKPVKMPLEAGKLYAWCTCGYSKNQPMCDGEHKHLDETRRGYKKHTFQFKPHRFRVEESKEYWLCNCKQTNNRPFCDGAHKAEEVQSLKHVR